MVQTGKMIDQMTYKEEFLHLSEFYIHGPLFIVCV